jgi:hypothetical protein
MGKRFGQNLIFKHIFPNTEIFDVQTALLMLNSLSISVTPMLSAVEGFNRVIIFLLHNHR